MVEALVTASPEFFKGKKRAEIRAFFEDALDFIEKHQSKETIIFMLLRFSSMEE